MVERPLIRGALRQLPATAIIEALAASAQTWADPSYPPRRQCARAIEARTGYSAPVVRFALDQLFASITRHSLTATICAEIGSIDALDRFVARDGRPDGFAKAVGEVCVIASRTTVGVALLPALYALCAKCDVTVKDREDNLIAAFFRTLEEHDKSFGHAAHAEAFSSHDVQPDFLRRFSCVVAFGNDDTLAHLRNACNADARFVGFGSRASAGYISSDAARSGTLDQLLENAALDAVLYETEGCMSLHMLLVEGADNAKKCRAALCGGPEKRR